MSAILSLACLVLALAAYAISQLHQHGQLKYGQTSDDYSFWGTKGYKRKEFMRPIFQTFLVAFTDGYHFMQFWFFNFLALGFTLAIGWSWWLFLGLLVGIRLAHWALRETFKK